MLKIVHRVCCGIDVHKDFLVATIASTNDQNVTTYSEAKKFRTFRTGLISLKNWLASNNCDQVCMESTGKYWIPVFNMLEDSCKITLANPRHIKNFPGRKTDKRDSQWIADLHKHNLVRGSFIPPKPIRELRDLMRYRSKLVKFNVSEKNRIQNSLTVSNLMIASVVSDTFGKSASAIIKYAMSHPDQLIDDDFTRLLHKSMLPKADEINLSMQGTLSKEQAAKMGVCFDHFESVGKCISKLDTVISLLSSDFNSKIDLLQSAPGIKQHAATVIISEIGTDMSVFPDSKHLNSWAGLSPQANISAGVKKSVHVSRAGVYLKPILVQCANAAITDKNCPYFKHRYNRIKKRRGHKRAIIAIARMLLTCIYNMLQKNEPFDLARYAEYLKQDIQPSSQNSIDKAILLLQSQGFVVSKSDATSQELSQKPSENDTSETSLSASCKDGIPQEGYFSQKEPKTQEPESTTRVPAKVPSENKKKSKIATKVLREKSSKSATLLSSILLPFLIFLFCSGQSIPKAMAESNICGAYTPKVQQSTTHQEYRIDPRVQVQKQVRPIMNAGPSRIKQGSVLNTASPP